MRFIRFGNFKKEKPGILDINGIRRDVSHLFRDWDRSCFEDNDIDSICKMINDRKETLPIVAESERWGSCIARPGKVICVGLNYSDHAKESGMEIPAEPIIFQKAANTVVGPFDDIHIPRTSLKTDWEVELGVVIGKTARYLDSAADAKEYIAGYCISHDVSERAFQLERGGQWTKGKSCDTFNPLGPYMATTDEIGDIENHSMSLSVNGLEMQRGNTSHMIFGCYYLVYYLSQFMSLEPGDLINTGTPHGVGLGMNPPQYLKAGDMVSLTIEGLGMQKQTCVQD